MARSEPKNVLTSSDEIELTVAGRRSGHKTTRPVWFVQEGKSLYLLPVSGSDTEWYKNMLKNPTIMLAADGEKWTAKATPITDAAKVREIVEKFRAKHGAADVKKYYSKFDVAVEVPLT